MSPSSYISLGTLCPEVSGYIPQSSTLVHDLAASFGHRQYFSPGFSSSKVLLLRHRLHLQVSVSFTINSTVETMGEVLHIVSSFIFNYMRLECTYLVLLNRRGQDIYPTDITPIRFRQSSTTIFPIFHCQLHFRDYGGCLAHPLQLCFLLYAAGMHIFLLLDLCACTVFPSDITPFPGS